MKSSHKRLLSWLLALAMLLTLLPAVTLTASAAGPVAEVDGAEYDDFDNAVAAWTDGTTLKLLANVVLSDLVDLTSCGDLTLDLNSFTLSGDISIWVTDTNLTMQDSVGGGKVDGITAAVVIDSGSLTLVSGTIGSDDCEIGVYAVGGDVYLNGGNVVCGGDDGNSAVYTYDTSVSVTVDGATVGSQTSTNGIYGYECGSIKIRSGEVLSKGYTVESYTGTVEISGGTIQSYTTSGASAVQISESAECTIYGNASIVSSGSGVYVGDYANAAAGSKCLTITGGTIDADVYGVHSNGTASESITIDISGGSITGDAAALYSPNRNETVNITGGTFTGGTAIAVKGGTVNISGDTTIVSTGAKQDAGENPSGFTDTGDAIYVEDTYPNYNPTVNILGEEVTVTSTYGYAMQYYASQNAAPAEATGHIEASAGTFASPLTPVENNNSILPDKILLSGGTYDAEPNPGDLEPGKIAIQNEQGKWVIGESFFKGYSLSLMGDIAVNFYVGLGTLDPADVTIEYTTTDGQTMSATAFSALSVDAATNWYKFTVPFAAKEMTDTVTATLKKNGTELETRTYSVAKYASRVYLNENNEFDTVITSNLDKLQALCKAMLVYGAKAQAQFSNYNDPNYADAALTTADKTPEAVDAGTLPDYPAGVDLSAFGLSFTESSLVLETKTTHRLYFNVKDDTKARAATVKCGSTPLQLVVEGSTAYVDIPNIAARNVLKNYTVTFSNGSDTVKLRVNAGSYIKNALAGSDETLKDTVTALHAYSTAAEAYFAAN